VRSNVSRFGSCITCHVRIAIAASELTKTPRLGLCLQEGSFSFFRLFYFYPFFRKIITNTLLGAVIIGAKITLIGASAFDAKVFTHVSIDADVTLAWQRAWR
jgi:hypothetical protein